ncbi:hypothetical protein CNEO4_540047 [Clostridium neonatale]|nr:hypothetical protein CNEO4_540047 [Clostridium neonatale]
MTEYLKNTGGREMMYDTTTFVNRS